MLEMTRIRTERDELIQALKKRNIDVTETIDALIEKDQQWRNAKTQMESITADLNKIAKEMEQCILLCANCHRIHHHEK